MIDISPIEKYIQPIDSFPKGLIEYDVKNLGKDNVFNTHLRYLDCSIVKNGYRQQTIGFPYIFEMTNIMYIIKTYFKEEEDVKLKQVLDLHQKNLEYEKENPPVWYKNKKIKKTKENKSNKSNKSKQTTSQIKEKLKLGKINALKFNLKLINNGNNNTI